jgi:hypothetical protein
MSMGLHIRIWIRRANETMQMIRIAKRLAGHDGYDLKRVRQREQQFPDH